MISVAPEANRGRVLRGAAIGASIVVLVLTAMAAWFGLRSALGALGRGLPALPLTIGVNAAQLLLAGIAWGALLPVRLPVLPLWRARWVRESVNSILPVASLGGSVVGARLLARNPGIDTATAGASAAVDITNEAVAQFGFLLCALLLAGTLPHAPFRPAWVLLAALAMVAGLIGIQAAGLFRWLEHLAQRILRGRVAPLLRALRLRLRAMYVNPARMAANIGGNFLSWSVGAVEAWILLRALGHQVPWRAAYAIECLGLIARSLGFALPAGIGAQETGFVLAGALFGVPHETALALSLLKRVRELVVGVGGVLYWQWVEWRPPADRAQG